MVLTPPSKPKQKQNPKRCREGKKARMPGLAWYGDTSLIPELGSQRQVDLWEFEASMVYLESSRPARATG